MNHKNKIFSIFLVLTFAFLSFACQNQQAGPDSTPTAQSGEKAQTPTEAYKMLFAAVKAKDTDRIKQMMSKGTLVFAEGYGQQTKQTVAEALRNGFTATVIADSLPEMRDERVKDNFGALEVFNQTDKNWEDLPFVLEDGGWKLAVGDVFQNTYKSPGEGMAQIERGASNMMMPSNTVTNFPTMPKGKKSMQFPPVSDGDKSIEVPKEDKQANKPKK